MALITSALIHASGKRGVGGYTSTRRYLLEFDEQKTEFEVIDEATTGIFGAAHASKAGLFLLNKRAEVANTADLTTWHVTCDYGLQTLKSRDDQDEGADKSTKYDWRVVVSDVPVDTDINDDVIKNPAGESFDPPLIKEHFDTQVVITKYFDDFTSDKTERWFGKINSEAWQVDNVAIGAEVARIINVEQEELWDNNGASYFKVLITIDFRSDGWARRVLNEGYSYLDGDGYLKIAKDSDENPLNEPIWLNADGTKNFSTTTPTFTNFDLYDTLNYNNEDLL